MIGEDAPPFLFLEGGRGGVLLLYKKKFRGGGALFSPPQKKIIYFLPPPPQKGGGGVFFFFFLPPLLGVKNWAPFFFSFKAPLFGGCPPLCCERPFSPLLGGPLLPCVLIMGPPNSFWGGVFWGGPPPPEIPLFFENAPFFFRPRCFFFPRAPGASKMGSYAFFALSFPVAWEGLPIFSLLGLGPFLSFLAPWTPQYLGRVCGLS